MNLSYKKNFPWGDPTNFVQKIMDGIKIHTFREDPHNKWYAGRHAHHATGIRTKNYNCFLENDCTGTQKAEINWFLDGDDRDCDFVQVSVDSTLLFEGERGFLESGIEYADMERLAKNDGFDSVEDFFKWFNNDFSGVIIHWTDFRY